MSHTQASSPPPKPATGIRVSRYPRQAPKSLGDVMAPIDRRTKIGRAAMRLRAELTAHCGGSPNAVQRRLIERAAMLALHLSRMDAKAITADCMSPHATREYLAWSNTLARTLKLLGMKGAAERPPSLADILARPAP